MSEAQHLSQALNRYFTNPNVGVFASFASATDRVTAAQAATVPVPRFNSVWGIVNHVWYWEETLLRLLRGQPVTHQMLGAPDESGWVPAGDPADDAGWAAARSRALATNAELATEIAGLTPEQLEEELEAWQTKKHRAIQAIIAHDSYHTCEIICVRHMQGLWLERT
jgi:hypothetical protein